MNNGLAQSDIDAIAHARESFLSALAGDDLDTLLGLLSHDGQAYPPHEEALVGIDANRAWHEGRIAEFESEMTLTTDELVGEGSLAFERFSYTLTLKPRAGGESIVDTGHCFWFWRREDGSWKVARAMWNSPVPLPEG